MLTHQTLKRRKRYTSLQTTGKPETRKLPGFTPR